MGPRRRCALGWLLVLSWLTGVPGSDPNTATVSITILDGYGGATQVLEAGQAAQLQVTLANLGSLNVTGQVTFFANSGAVSVTVPFGTSNCYTSMPAGQTMRFLCPFLAPSLAESASVVFTLGSVLYGGSRSALMQATTVPAVSFRVEQPGDLTQSDPIVLRVAIGPMNMFGSAVTLFRRADFTASFLVLCRLPPAVTVNVLDVSDLGSGVVQVTVALVWGTGNVVAAFQQAMQALNTNSTVQQALLMVPPALLGTDCPTALNATCAGHGLCQYLDGACQCAPGYQSLACDELAPTVIGYPAATGAIGFAILSCWLIGWPASRALWACFRSRRKQHHEIFTHLSPLHRTTTGTLVYRTAATAYLALCLAGCAFPANAPWTPAAEAFYIPQICRYLRLDIPNTRGLPILAYVLVALFVPYCLYMNKRLIFLVHMDTAAWHHPLTSLATQRLVSKPMTWSKPRVKPPGYTPHYALLLVHFFYPTLVPLILGLLVSTFTCDQIAGTWVARYDHSVRCFATPQVVNAAVAGTLLLLFYATFLLSSYVFVAATERLQNRNLELGLPSLIRDQRGAFLAKTQLVMLVIVTDGMLSSVGPLPFTIAGVALCGSLAFILVLYQLRTSPCNIPIVNWISVAAYLFPLWCYILAIPAFLLPPAGVKVVVEVLAGLFLGHILCSGIVVAAMRRAAMGVGGQAPAWFALRMADATRREEAELCRLNSTKHLAKEDLDIDVEGLPTPRSIPNTPAIQRRPDVPRQRTSSIGTKASPAAAGDERASPHEEGAVGAPASPSRVPQISPFMGRDDRGLHEIAVACRHMSPCLLPVSDVCKMASIMEDGVVPLPPAADDEPINLMSDDEPSEASSARPHHQELILKLLQRPARDHKDHTDPPSDV